MTKRAKQEKIRSKHRLVCVHPPLLVCKQTRVPLSYRTKKGAPFLLLVTETTNQKESKRGEEGQPKGYRVVVFPFLEEKSENSKTGEAGSQF
jgi:hypothetical protein